MLLVPINIIAWHKKRKECAFLLRLEYQFWSFATQVGKSILSQIIEYKNLYSILSKVPFRLHSSNSSLHLEFEVRRWLVLHSEFEMRRFLIKFWGEMVFIQYFVFLENLRYDLFHSEFEIRCFSIQILICDGFDSEFQMGRSSFRFWTELWFSSIILNRVYLENLKYDVFHSDFKVTCSICIQILRSDVHILF